MHWSQNQKAITTTAKDIVDFSELLEARKLGLCKPSLRFSTGGVGAPQVRGWAV